MKKTYNKPVIEICNYSIKDVSCGISEGTEYGREAVAELFDIFAEEETL